MIDYLDDTIFEVNKFFCFFFCFHKWFLKMLYYDRAYASEGIDPAKRNNSKECIAYT